MRDITVSFYYDCYEKGTKFGPCRELQDSEWQGLSLQRGQLVLTGRNSNLFLSFGDDPCKIVFEIVSGKVSLLYQKSKKKRLSVN